MKKFKVWYFRDEHSQPALLGDNEFVNFRALEKTHIFLKEQEANDLEDLYRIMQAEVWSPRGEARPTIERLGLTHTSMSMGDIAVDEAGAVWLVAFYGFTRLGQLAA